MTPEILNELNQAVTIDDLFNVLKKHYPLENITLSILHKNIMIRNLMSILDILNIKERQ